tara:strand:- start:98 stop:241 length:144 start_codon:yes stop_codon:yes gene_type:complete
VLDTASVRACVVRDGLAKEVLALLKLIHQLLLELDEPVEKVGGVSLG